MESAHLESAWNPRAYGKTIGFSPLMVLFSHFSLHRLSHRHPPAQVHEEGRAVRSVPGGGSARRARRVRTARRRVAR